jgi:hypothetical protein
VTVEGADAGGSRGCGGLEFVTFFVGFFDHFGDGGFVDLPLREFTMEGGEDGGKRRPALLVEFEFVEPGFVA